MNKNDLFQVCVDFRNLWKDGDKMAKEEWTRKRKDEKIKLKHKNIPKQDHYRETHPRLA